MKNRLQKYISIIKKNWNKIE